jgi:predicted TPR repeat methyltransferase
MIDLIVNIKNFLINILMGLKASIKLIINNAINLPANAKNVRAKIANLEETNLEMANYHLKNGNLNDAILRINILLRFIAPNSPKAFYKLAWCYFIKKDFARALENLNKCPDLDVYGLKKHLLSNDPEEIPLRLLQEYKNLALARYLERFINKRVDLGAVLLDMMMQYTQDLPKKCQILDLGSSAGGIGEKLAALISKEYTLTGVEDSQAMLEQTRLVGAYDNICNMELEDFLLNTQTKYDIILSLNSLSFTKNLCSYFNKIHNILKTDGYFISAFKVGEISKLDSNKVEFLYARDDLEKNIIDSKFMIIQTKIVEFNSSTSYFFVLCKLNTQLNT